MRIRILICAALSLSACGGKTAADNSAVTEENAAGQTIVTNDVTAIDAATGEAANMAPDVNYAFNAANLESENETSNGSVTHRPARKPSKPAAAESNSTESAPPSNSV